MEPRNWDGASVDRSVLSRMRRLDPKLKVTFSPYALNPFTGDVIEQDGYGEDCEKLTGPCSDPAFYLWRKCDKAGWIFVQSYPVTQGFGHREVLALESDLARWHSPDKVWEIIDAKTRGARERLAQQKRNDMRDKVMDNKKLAMDVASGKSTFRDPKTFSYSGQARRTSSAEGAPVQRSNRELGIGD